MLCIDETTHEKSSLYDNLFNTWLDSIPLTYNFPHVFLYKNTYNLFEREIYLKLTNVEIAGFEWW